MKVKREFYKESTGGIKNLERRFSQMAEKGWMIDKIGFMSLRYKAIEPCKLRFYVDILPQIGTFDYPHNKDAVDYRSLCEEAGWNYVTSSRGVNVFCTDTESDPVPIHTDNRIQNRIYLKHYIKSELLAYILIFVILLPLFMGPSLPFVTFVATLFLNDFMMFFWFGLSILMVWTFLNILVSTIWFLRTLYAKIRDFPLPVIGYRTEQVLNVWLIAGLIIMILCLVIGAVLDMVPMLIITLAINLVVILVSFILHRRIETKENSKIKNILQYVVVLVGVIFFTFFLLGTLTFSLLFSSSSFDSWAIDYREEIVDDRPIITLDTLGIDPEDDAYFQMDINRSVAVPINFRYIEFGRTHNSFSSSQPDTVSTGVQTARHKYIAYLLFADAIRPHEYWGDRQRMDSSEASLWGAEMGLLAYGSIYSEWIDLFLLKDKTVLRIGVSVDADVDIELLQQAVIDIWAELFDT